MPFLPSNQQRQSVYTRNDDDDDDNRDGVRDDV